MSDSTDDDLDRIACPLIFKTYVVDYCGLTGWMRPDGGEFVAYGPAGQKERFGTRGDAAYAIAEWLLDED